MNRISPLLCTSLAVAIGAARARAQSMPFGGEMSDVVVSSDPIQGDYQGKWVAAKGFLAQNPRLVAQVITRGNGKYEIVFHGEFDKRSACKTTVGTRSGFATSGS